MAFRRRSLRSFQVLLLQRGNAAFAAWTASSRPSLWVSVTLASSSPVTGSEIFIDLEELILWPFTIFGNPADRRAFFSACSRLGWGIDGGVAFEFIQSVLSASCYEGASLRVANPEALDKVQVRLERVQSVRRDQSASQRIPRSLLSIM